MKRDQEPRHLFFGDHLKCMGCGGVVWSPNERSPVWRFREIDVYYRQHARGCMPLKRILVSMRRIKS